MPNMTLKSLILALSLGMGIGLAYATLNTSSYATSSEAKNFPDYQAFAFTGASANSKDEEQGTQEQVNGQALIGNTPFLTSVAYQEPSAELVRDFYRTNRQALAQRYAYAQEHGSNLFIATYPAASSTTAWGQLYDLQVMADFYQWSAKDLYTFFMQPVDGSYANSVALANLLTQRHQLVAATAILSDIGVSPHEVAFYNKSREVAAQDQQALQEYLATLNAQMANLGEQEEIEQIATYRAYDDAQALFAAANQMGSLEKGNSAIASAQAINVQVVAAIDYGHQDLTLDSSSYYLTDDNILVYQPSVESQIYNIIVQNAQDLAALNIQAQIQAQEEAVAAALRIKEQAALAAQDTPVKKKSKVGFASFKRGAKTTEETAAAATVETSSNDSMAIGEGTTPTATETESRNEASTTKQTFPLLVPVTDDASLFSQQHVQRLQFMESIPGYAQAVIDTALLTNSEIKQIIQAGQTLVEACAEYDDFQYNTAPVTVENSVDADYNNQLSFIRQVVNKNNRVSCGQARTNLHYLQQFSAELQYLLHQAKEK